MELQHPRHPKRPISFPQRQRGMVLLVIMLVTLTVGGYFGVRALNATVARGATDDAETERILTQAKAALLAWSVRTNDDPSTDRISMSATNGIGLRAFRPGNLPYPDLANNVSTTVTAASAQSDGERDNGCASRPWTTGTGTLRPVLQPLGLALTPTAAQRRNLRCFGRLPFKTLGLPNYADSSADAAGRWPWYIVSANLVSTDDICPARLDSSLAAPALTATAASDCGSAAATPVALPFPWLIVRDPFGNLISNRVAAVIILPGPVTSRGTVSQTRSPTALAGQYLDTVTNPSCPGGTCDNALLNTLPNTTPMTFIQCVKPSTTSGDARFNINYSCNDRLAYITVDELFNHAARRLEREFANCLNEYANNSSPVRASQIFPWAAITNPSGVSADQYAGMFPSAGVTTDAAPPGGQPPEDSPCPKVTNGSASAYLSGWQREATYTLGDGTPAGGRKSATFQFASLNDPRTGQPRAAITVRRP